MGANRVTVGLTFGWKCGWETLERGKWLHNQNLNLCHQHENRLQKSQKGNQSTLQSDPPALDPTEYGWIKDDKTKTLVPVSLRSDIHIAPTDILAMICCGCATDRPCSSTRCGSCNAQLLCTIFCKCHRSGNCQNKWRKKVAAAPSLEQEDSDQSNQSAEKLKHCWMLS